MTVVPHVPMVVDRVLKYLPALEQIVVQNVSDAFDDIGRHQLDLRLFRVKPNQKFVLALSLPGNDVDDAKDAVHYLRSTAPTLLQTLSPVSLPMFVFTKLVELRVGYENFLANELELRLSDLCQNKADSPYYYARLRFLCLVEGNLHRWNDRWQNVVRKFLTVCSERLEIFSFDSQFEVLPKIAEHGFPNVRALYIESDALHYDRNSSWPENNEPEYLEMVVTRGWILRLQHVKQAFPLMQFVRFNGMVHATIISRRPFRFFSDVVNDTEFLQAAVWSGVERVEMSERKIYRASSPHVPVGGCTVNSVCRLRWLCPNACIVFTNRIQWPLARSYERIDPICDQILPTQLKDLRNWLRFGGGKCLVLRVGEKAELKETSYWVDRWCNGIKPLSSAQLDQSAFSALMSWIVSTACRLELVLDSESTWQEVEKVLQYWRVEDSIPKPNEPVCKVDLRIKTKPEMPLDQLVRLWMEQRRKLSEAENSDFDCERSYKLNNVYLEHQLDLDKMACNAVQTTTRLEVSGSDASTDVSHLSSFNPFQNVLQQMVALVNVQETSHINGDKSDCLPRLICKRLVHINCYDRLCCRKDTAQHLALFRNIRDRNCTANGSTHIRIDAEIDGNNLIFQRLKSCQVLDNSVLRRNPKRKHSFRDFMFD